MSIIACTVTADRDHENADRLRVYQVEAPGVESTQVVANKDNVYATGDVVAAALVGTVLPDGTAISKGKIRGVLSFGMLLGKTAAAPGTDLTAEMGATSVEKVVDESTGVVEDSNWPRYTSVQSFLRVRDELLACDEVVVTEKAHGSNARFGFHGSRPFMVGTHTSRVVDSRLRASTWPEGNLIRKTLEWVEREGVEARVAAYRARHPEVNSLSVFGEICGWKCSDLHYGRTAESGSEVLLFGEMCRNGQFLGYDEALRVIRELFPEHLDHPIVDPLTRVSSIEHGISPSMSRLLVPVLYRGKPDIAVLKKLRDQVSTLAAERGETQISEGIVVRPTKEAVSKATLGRLIGKYKSPLYEERKSLRSKDPDQLPTYVSAYDLIYDFVTDERILHVIAKAESGGMVIAPNSMNKLVPLLYADIRKESVGEWPPGSEALDEGVLVRWTHDIACDEVARLIQDRQKGAY